MDTERLGKLVWAAAGYTAAALAAEYLLPTAGLPYFAAALAVCSAAALLLRGRARRAALTALLAGAAALLLWWGRYTLLIAPCEALRGQDITITAEVTDYPDAGDGYAGIPIRITDGAPRVRGYLYSYDETPPDVSPGDEITVQVRVLSAMETNAGARRHTQTARGRSFLGRTMEEIAVTGRSDRAWQYFPQRLAQAVKDRCAALFPADVAALGKALMTGDKGDLYADEAVYAPMRAAGVLHIVAVSGMHIVILVSFLQLLLGRSRRSSLICIPVMVVFVLMTGGGASAVRAAIMQSVLLLAPLAEREYDGPSSLAAALLAILLANPMAVGGISLQLSFACVLGFTVLMPGLHAWCFTHLPMRRRLVSFAADSVICSICAMAFSLPLAALYFGVIPLFSWLANLLTLLPVELCFAGSYIVCAVGAVFPAAGAALAGVLAWLFRWCMLVYRVIAAIPFSCLDTTFGPGAWLWLAGVYILFAVWTVLRRRGVRLTLWLPAELCVIGACAVLLTGTMSLPASGALMVLDVGQGACAALVNETAAVVIDCGGSLRTNAGSLASDLLLSRGRGRVDVLVLTHLHEDHTNGVSALMARLPVSLLILPADHDDEDGMLDRVLRAAEKNGTEVMALSEDTCLRVGGIDLTLLLPEGGTNENERGIVVQARIGALDALIMGDAGQSAERALMERGLAEDTDVLVVGHHGAAGAAGTLFLRAVTPETAVISVGAGNAYGHPAEETVERLEDAGAAVLRTDEDGTITIWSGDYG